MELRTAMEQVLHAIGGDNGVLFWRRLNRSTAPSVPNAPDLRAAVDARHVACGTTSKNIQGRLGPEPKYPSRPSGGIEDRDAREVFGIDQLVPEPPSTEQLRTAIKSARRGE